jgi:hypothetical protein
MVIFKEMVVIGIISCRVDKIIISIIIKIK